MRRLLTAGVVTVLLIVLQAEGQPPQAEAATVIGAYLYHPVGSGPNTARMKCGWHKICDGMFPDSSLEGLDWVWEGNVSTQIYVRIRAFGGSAAPTAVALGRFSTPILGCKRSQFELFRYSDAQVIGMVLNLHSSYPQEAEALLNSSTGGTNNEYGAGSMLTSGDNCFSTGTHTHQQYKAENSSVTRNSGQIPNEPSVINPNPIDPWADPYEYYFSFSTALWGSWSLKGAGANPDAHGLSHERTVPSSSTALVRRAGGDVYVQGTYRRHLVGIVGEHQH